MIFRPELEPAADTKSAGRPLYSIKFLRITAIFMMCTTTRLRLSSAGSPVQRRVDGFILSFGR